MRRLQEEEEELEEKEKGEWRASWGREGEEEEERAGAGGESGALRRDEGEGCVSVCLNSTRQRRRRHLGALHIYTS